MRFDRAKLTSLLLIVPACLALAGCSSDGGDAKKTAGEQRSAAAVGGLKETRADLVAGRAQIEKTVAAMNAMRDNQGALAAEFATFNEEIKKSDVHAQKTRARATDMRARAKAYQDKWRAEMATVDDPTLRSAANARADAVRDRYEGITTKAGEARAAYEPFMKQLKSVQTYLSNDLTPAGVQGASAVFDKATADAKTVTEKIDAVVAELDAVASALSPAGATASTPPPKK
jgi:hypothetical protein